MAPGAFAAAEAQGEMLPHLSADQKEEKGQEAGWDLKSQCHPTSDQQPTSFCQSLPPKGSQSCNSIATQEKWHSNI